MSKIKANPPLLIGGSLQIGNENFSGVLMDSHIDYLTVSVAPDTAKFLLSGNNTTLYQAGYGRHGFQSSEQRLCIGGRCWRRWQPTQSNNSLIRQWGDYESWEFDGQQADYYFNVLSSYACRPSRIDIAFDYLIPENYIPNDFINEFRSKIFSNGLKIGISGGEVDNTRYVGSGTSERRIRVYRKDWQSPMYKKYGAVLRIELVLRKLQAQSFWGYYLNNGKEACLKLAASNIFDMTGFIPIPEDLVEIPKIDRPIANSAVVRIYNFFKQYGGFLDILFELNVDVRGLSAFQSSKSSRMSRHRCDCFKSELYCLSPDDIKLLIFELLSLNEIKSQISK